jgi:hypothetical protein
LSSAFFSAGDHGAVQSAALWLRWPPKRVIAPAHGCSCRACCPWPVMPSQQTAPLPTMASAGLAMSSRTGARYGACSWPHLSRMGLSVGVLRISPRRCRWDRGRVRRGGRRLGVRAPVGRSGGSEDCGRASTESRSCWRRCSAGGGSESWSIRVRSLRARGARRSMIVRYRGASLHSTRTWWRACSGTRAVHHRCMRATSSSGRAFGVSSRGEFVLRR